MSSTERHVKMFPRHCRFTILVIVYENKQYTYVKEKNFMLKYSLILSVSDNPSGKNLMLFLLKRKYWIIFC